MAEPSMITGIFIIFLIAVIGSGAYIRMNQFIKMKKNCDIVSKEKELLELGKNIDLKKAQLEKISEKIKKAKKDLADIKELKKLKNEVLDKNKKNHELEMEVKRLKHNLKSRRYRQSVGEFKTAKQSEDNGSENIKKKYPALPKSQLERIEIERTIARSLMKNNGGSFFTSQILRKLEGLYQRHIKPNDRLMLLNEIKSWIERDPLCKGVKTTDKIQHYTFI